MATRESAIAREASEKPTAGAQTSTSLPPAEIRIEDLKRHVATLASDTLEGREAGTRGGQAAAAYLAGELRRLKLSPAGEGNGYFQDFPPGFRNVLALLPGDDVRLRNEVIVIGAHYDHVGMGNQRTSFGPLGQIHNGADDNASGTSVVLELCEYFAAGPALPRTVMFAFWDAEEIGLLGSKHWVSHPTIPRERIKFNINLDMVGRLRNSEVVVVGTRTAAGLRQRAARSNANVGLQLLFANAMADDTDHYSFFQRGVPVLHFDTGKHDDYHRPSDDAEKLNFAGLQQIGQLVRNLARDLATVDAAPEFHAPKPGDAPPPAAPAYANPNPRLGLNWIRAAPPGKGLIVEFITPNSAADLAGLRVGDHILTFGVWRDGTDDDFRTVVQTHREEATELTYLRDDDPRPRTTTVRLTGRPVTLGVALWSDPLAHGALLVRQSTRWSPADRAGVVAGDYILAANGTPVASELQLLNAIDLKSKAWRLDVERRGQVVPITVRNWTLDPSTP